VSGNPAAVRRRASAPGPEHDAVVAAASMAIGVIDVREDLQVTG
jgi:hypothetical protein